MLVNREDTFCTAFHSKTMTKGGGKNQHILFLTVKNSTVYMLSSQQFMKQRIRLLKSSDQYFGRKTWASVLKQ